MAAGSVKVLAVGAAAGSIRDLFTKIKAIDAKHGKFDFVLCTGDFFGPPVTPDPDEGDEVSMLLAGQLEAPLDCYIMQGEYPLPGNVIDKFANNGGEICKNVFLLSKSGTITTAHGLRIACLGGIFDPEIYAAAEAAPGFLSPYFTNQTIERLLSNTLTKSSSGQNYTSLAAIQSTASSSQLIDILISNAWPSSITQHSLSPLPATDLGTIGVQVVDDVVRYTKPRYHFAAGGGKPAMFWEREPYVWGEVKSRISRFVSLGPFGAASSSGKKQRWFYAFSIAPDDPSAVAAPQPPNATKNPFVETGPKVTKRSLEMPQGENYIFGNVQPIKRPRVAEPGQLPPGYKCRRCESTEHLIDNCPERTKPPDGYICRICGVPGHLVRDCPTKHALGDTGGRKPKPGYVCRACGSEAHLIEDCLIPNEKSSHIHVRGARPPRTRGGPPKPIAPDECWFCLSNPNLAKHLIVAIGAECYVTLPKGQIIPTQSPVDRLGVPGGGHVLIVPITHYPTYTTIPLDLASPIIEETETLKSALRAMYAKYNQAAVMFEVGRLGVRGGHAHVQVVPVPLSLRDRVEEAFVNEGRLSGIDFESEPDAALQSCAGGTGGYFRVDLPDGRRMVHLMKEGIPFSIQFGRQVLVSLMNIPDRLDWKACMLSEQDDKTDAQTFKEAFAPFNPSN
ncbi:CwfJ C-terminus 1-domain-containing protein-like protein [Infundibulicybe gibba]|nr:CwfJ C-terminus 1-domain-containing protein-like protein [Infundibulicybe gibba]